MNIKVQQDNARPHASVHQQKILEAGNSDGWNIDLICQPANNPDFNVSDLGYFNAIQSLQHQYAPKSGDDLIRVVQESFDALSPETLDSVFLFLRMAMESAMKAEGGNNYKLAHMGKAQKRRDKTFPVSIRCSQEAIALAKGLIVD